MIYTVTLNPAIDCRLTADSITSGKVNRIASQAIHFSGKGINVSHVLKEFGEDSVIMGFVAGFMGDALVRGLESKGFSLDPVWLSEGETRINVKMSSATEDGDPDTELNAPGPVPRADELEALTEKLARLSLDDTVVIAGSLPSGVSPDYVNRIAQVIPDGVSLFCDLSGAALRAALKSKPNFVKPNIHELYELMEIPCTDATLSDMSLVKSCAEGLMSMGVGSALITMGDAGAYFISHTGEAGFIKAPAEPVCSESSRSAVGCGDSTVAGWLIGMGHASQEVKKRAFSLLGIDPSSGDCRAAAQLAVAMGSASYYMGFPPSPDKLTRMRP